MGADLERARSREWAHLGVWTLVYLVAHLLGDLFRDPVRHVAVLWPASGVTLAALLVTRRERRLVLMTAVALVGLLLNLTSHERVGMSVGFCIANTVDAWLGVVLVERVCKRAVTFTRVDEVLALGAAVTVVNAATSVLAAATCAVFGPAPFWPSYRTWWGAVVLGGVLVTPLLLVWTRGRTADDEERPSRPAEAGAFLVTWSAAAWIASSVSFHGPFAPRPYMLVCLLPWAALRLGLRTVTASMTILCAAVVRASRGGGIDGFEGGSVTDAVTRAQLYVALASLTGLLLAASTSEARRARRAADRSASRLTLALDAARMGAWEWEVGTDRIHWSAHAMGIFGVTGDAFAGTFDAYLAMIHPDDRVLVATEIERALGAPASDYTVEHRIVRPDGEIRWLECRGRVDRDATGTPVRMAGTVVDVSEPRQVAERLRQTQKMEAFGQLAGGVAHDFNNLLSVILMQAEMARRTGAVGRELLGEIVGAAERGSALTKQLLAFARQQVGHPRPVDLNAAVASVASMLGRVIPEEVRMRLDLSPSPLVARVDVGMLDQMIVNLAVNARDAMPSGGELTIATYRTAIADGPADGVPAGDYVAIRVTDTGTGIVREHMPRLFEPFFSTKPPGQGTGLGLATVFGILRLHHGHVRVTSEVGKGSAFELLLPRSDALPEPLPAPAVEASTKRRSGTILLVEDDERVRMTTRKLLELHDYEVIEARNSADALRLWEEHADRIDLLFTDLTMPGPLDGRQLAAELRKRCPTLKVIVTSGYDVHAHREADPGARFLMKPSTLPELLEAVSGALDA